MISPANSFSLKITFVAHFAEVSSCRLWCNFTFNRPHPSSRMPKKSNTKAKKLPALLEACQELFDTTDLYVVIGIRKAATPQEGSVAYTVVS